LDGRFRHSRIVPATEDELSDDIENRAADQHHDDQRVRQRVARHLRQPMKNLHGRDGVKVEHQWRTKLGEAPDQNDRPAREQSRPHQWQRDSPENRATRCAKVRRRLFHRRIDVRQRGRDVQEEDRIERQRLDENDAEQSRVAEPVDRRVAVNESDFRRDRRQRSEPPENLPHPNRADERRQDQRHQQQCVDDRFAAKVISHGKNRQRHADANAHDRHANGDERTVDQPLAKVGVEKDRLEVAEREPAGAGVRAADAKKRDAHDLVNRPEQKDGEDRQDEREQQVGTGATHVCWSDAVKQ
jgi:hypothetical protein